MTHPRAVVSLYDEPMWKSIEARRWELQQCDSCGTHRYPPAPVCHKCLSMSCTWKPLSGRGKILSWVIFHRQYLDDYPPPYNVIAVQLAEGPIVISNLVGETPKGSWIGHDVEICYESGAEGAVIPKMKLAQ